MSISAVQYLRALTVADLQAKEAIALQSGFQPVGIAFVFAGQLVQKVVQGAIGIFQVDLELNSSLTTDPATQLTISQDTYTSNIITFPLVAPAE